MLDSIESKLEVLNVKTIAKSTFKKIENEEVRKRSLTIGGKGVNLQDETEYDDLSQMKWKRMLTDYISMRVQIKLYRLLIRIREEGNTLEEPISNYSEGVREELDLIGKDIKQVDWAYSRRTVINSKLRNMSVRKFLSFLLMKKSEGLRGEGLVYEIHKSKGESRYHIVNGLDNLGLEETDIDILTTYTKKQLLNSAYNRVKVDLGEEQEGDKLKYFSDLYYNLYGKSVYEVFGESVRGSGDKLVLYFSNTVDELEELLKHKLITKDSRGMLGELIIKIKEDVLREEEDEDLSKFLKEHSESDVESGYKLSEVLSEFKTDAFGIGEEVVKLETKNLEKQPKESEDKVEQEEVKEEQRVLNFKSVDNFYKFFSKEGKGSPSEGIYLKLKDGGVSEDVILDFMECKDISYYDYLEIESLLKK